MNKLLKKIEDLMVAVTFAESGEFDTAKKILGQTTIETEDKITERETETT